MTAPRLKRAFDVVGACAGLLVFAPVMAVVIPAVLLDDGGPVLSGTVPVAPLSADRAVVRGQRVRKARVRKLARHVNVRVAR